MHTCHNTDTLKRFELSLDPSPTKSTNQCEERHQSGWLLRSRLTNTEQNWCFLFLGAMIVIITQRDITDCRDCRDCEIWTRINYGFAPLYPVFCFVWLFYSVGPLKKPKHLKHFELRAESGRSETATSASILNYWLNHPCIYGWRGFSFIFGSPCFLLHLAHLQPLLTCGRHKTSTMCCKLVNQPTPNWCAHWRSSAVELLGKAGHWEFHCKSLEHLNMQQERK